MFGASSLITPFFLGTVAGAIASGRNPAEGNGDRVGSWLNPVSVLVGSFAVASCVFLTGAFLGAALTHRAVAAVVAGWGVAQYPWLLVDQLRVSDGAGAAATLHALLVAVGIAVVLVLPDLGCLFLLTQTHD